MTGRNRQHLVSVAVAAVGLLAMHQGASAALYTWTQLGGGTFNWTDDNWGASGSYPNAFGDTASLNVNVGAITTIRTPAAGVTVGILNFGDSTATMFVSNLMGTSAGGTDKLIFDNGGAGAQFNHATGASADRVYGNIELKDNLAINSSVAGLRFFTVFSGGKGLTLTGTQPIYFSPGATSNNFSSFTINGARAILSGTSGIDTVNCDITIKSGSGGDAIQQFVGNVINDSATVDFTVARYWNAGGAEETIGALKGVAGSRYAFNGGAAGVLTLAGPADGLARDFAGKIGDGGFSADPGGMLTVVKKGAYTQTLSGAADNDLAHVKVENGVLALNKTPGVNAVGMASYEVSEVVTTYTGVNDLTVGDGVTLGRGEVRLMAANQIIDNCQIIFKGGIFNANGNAEAVGVASLLANSEIQMLSGSSSILAFANSSGAGWTPGAALVIRGWDGNLAGGGAEQLLFGSSASGLTPAQVSQISFVDPLGAPAGTYGAQILASGEVVPLVPEPAILGMVAMSSILVLRRRRA